MPQLNPTICKNICKFMDVTSHIICVSLRKGTFLASLHSFLKLLYCVNIKTTQLTTADVFSSHYKTAFTPKTQHLKNNWLLLKHS